MEGGLNFQTGEFAKLCGVNKRTLHYYDEQGISIRRASSTRSS